MPYCATHGCPLVFFLDLSVPGLPPATTGMLGGGLTFLCPVLLCWTFIPTALCHCLVPLPRRFGCFCCFILSHSCWCSTVRPHRTTATVWAQAGGEDRAFFGHGQTFSCSYRPLYSPALPIHRCLSALLLSPRFRVQRTLHAELCSLTDGAGLWNNERLARTEPAAGAGRSGACTATTSAVRNRVFGGPRLAARRFRSAPVRGDDKRV